MTSCASRTNRPAGGVGGTRPASSSPTIRPTWRMSAARSRRSAEASPSITAACRSATWVTASPAGTASGPVSSPTTSSTNAGSRAISASVARMSADDVAPSRRSEPASSSRRAAAASKAARTSASVAGDRRLRVAGPAPGSPAGSDRLPRGAGHRRGRRGHDPGPRQRRGERGEQQCGRGGARVLVPDAAGAQVAGPALERLQRDRRLGPLLGRRRGGLGRRRDGPAGGERVLVGADRRRERVDHRLVALGRGPEALDPFQRRLQRLAQRLGRHVRLGARAPCRPAGTRCRTAGRTHPRPWRSACCPPG